MKCKKCGNEFSGDVCPHCGTLAPKQTAQKDNGTLCMILGILGLVFSLFCFGWILAIASIVVGMKCKDTQTPGRRKVGMITSIITLALTVIILLAAAVSGDDSTTENEQVETATETISAETEVASSEAETETMPEANTSAMVDYIAAEAQESANQAATDEKRDEALDFIASSYPEYFSDNETMEQAIYYGYYLEFAYDINESQYAELGMDVEQAVKYVYRGTEAVEDEHVQENLKQIAEILNTLGYAVEGEVAEAEQPVSQTEETVPSEPASAEAVMEPSESVSASAAALPAQTDVALNTSEAEEQSIEPQSSTVYWTPGGEKYHSTQDCPSLARSSTILSGSLSDAQAAGKSEPCKNCH